MIELFLIYYAIVYVLWLLALVCTGETRRFWRVTGSFLVMPFVLLVFVTLGAIGFTLGLLVSPIMAIFSESYKEEFKKLFVKKEENV